MANTAFGKGLKMENNKLVNQVIPEEDIQHFSDTMGLITIDVSHAIVKISMCAEALLNDVMNLVKKINKQLYEKYLAEGAPLGDSQVGFFLWLKEEQEHAQKEDQHGH